MAVHDADGQVPASTRVRSALSSEGEMSGHAIPGAARCVLCEARIMPGNSIVRDAPEPVHGECWLRVSRVTVTLTRLLRSMSPGALCAPCLGTRLDIGERIARTAAWRLRTNPEFRVGLARCTGCGVRRITTRARRSAATSIAWTARGGNPGRVLAEFAVQVEGRVCLAVVGPAVLDPTALAELTGAFLDRRALRVYVLDLDGVARDAAMRSDPRVVIVAPVADLRVLPECPSLAAVDLRYGAVKERLSALVGLLDRHAEAVVRVRLESLVGFPAERDRASSDVRCRAAIVDAARAASLGGWHIAGVAPASPLGPVAPAFFLHLTAERREAKDLDTMIAQTAEALA